MRNRLRASMRAVLMAATVIATPVAAQSSRMALEGSVQLDGQSIPSTVVYRLLRADGSLIRSIAPYRMNPSQFGVRLTSSDELDDNDQMIIRVVLSRRDSFVARIAGTELRYHGSIYADPPVTRILLYRNHPPAVRRQCPDTTINENQTFRFRVTSLDDDGDTLSYRLVNGPAGMVVDQLSGYVSWTPTFEQAGQYEVVVGVTDGREEITSRRATMRVRNVDRPPRIERRLADLATEEGRPVTIVVEAADPDGEQLQYSLIERGYRFRLFSRTGVFEWAPSYEDAGVYRCIATVTDGLLSDTTDAFTITVKNANRPPTFARALIDTVIAEDSLLVLPLGAVDVDGDSVAYDLSLAPEGVNVGPTGVLTWRPSFDQAGSYVVVVAAHDREDTVEAVVRMLVMNKNRPPIPPAGGIGQDTNRFAFGRSFELSWPSAVDHDAEDTLRYTVHIHGSSVDTTLSGIADTSLTFLGRTRFSPDGYVQWTVSVNDGLREVPYDGTRSFRLVSVPVTMQRDPVVALPRGFRLSEAHSNASGTVTSLTYSIAEKSDVNLSVYTMLGERIETIASGERDPGSYEATFDASRLASGVYMFKLEAHPLIGPRMRDFVSTKRMVLVK